MYPIQEVINRDFHTESINGMWILETTANN